MKQALNIAAARLFDDVLDRAQTEMPEWYMQSAKTVLIAGYDMLRAAGHRSGVSQPAGWSRGASGFKKTARDDKSVLWIQRCGLFWMIERSRFLDCGDMRNEALAFTFGPMPIWAPTRQTAMRLAEHCDPIPCAPVAGYWADVGYVAVKR